MLEDISKRKILIISNNPLDIHGANGKTLESFFKDFPSASLAQLYLSNEIPNSEICENFYHVTERDILDKVLRKKNDCGGMIEGTSSHENVSNSNFQAGKNIPKNNVTRLGRELIWKTKAWKNISLKDWVDKFSPNLIFFCAGDSCFAYDITMYVQKVTGAKLITYFTDDYILPRFSLSAFFWFRRNWILKKMKIVIANSNKFMTISEQMRETYFDIFKKDSFVASNMTESFKDTSLCSNVNDRYTIVYTGGLHYGRYNILKEVGKAIQTYNENHDKKAILNIYCPQHPDEELISKINIENGSCYCGVLNQTELKKVLNKCDFPLHVESFEKKNMAKTKLSISTKITEYLSLEKCIIAVGPESVASMQLLKEYGYCVTQNNQIYSMIKNILEKQDLVQAIAKRAEEAYEAKFNSEIVRNNFMDFIKQD